MNDVTHFDEKLLGQLSISRDRLLFSGTSTRAVPKHARAAPSAPTSSVMAVRRHVRSHEAHDIMQHVRNNTIQKFCTLCECLNVDPLLDSSFFLALVLLSRHKSRLSLARQFLELRGLALDVEWTRVDDLPGLQEKFSSSSDWATLLSYASIELDPAGEEAAAADPVLRVLQGTLVSAGLATPQTPLEFAMTSLLYMTPAGTPSTKMLERLVTIRKIDCRDVEVKCLRAVAGFTDNLNNEAVFAASFLGVCLATVVRPELRQDVALVLEARRSDLREGMASTVHRTKLRDIVQRLHRDSELRYEQTFDSWCCHKKFATTTGLNVQRLLYFINAQSQSVDFALFADYFTSGMISTLSMQALTTIDIEPVLAVIASIRVYSNNIKSLIDFRIRCLEGLNVKARQALTQAQILQLYICCFQHESIRERCWKAVLPVYNHSIQRACLRFREEHAFELEAVVRSIIICHVMDVGTGPSST